MDDCVLKVNNITYEQRAVGLFISSVPFGFPLEVYPLCIKAWFTASLPRDMKGEKKRGSKMLPQDC